MVVNVHERIIVAPAADVGAGLDQVGGPGDTWWPSPSWPPMVLDGPLRVGVRGGHGPIRYGVVEHVPGRSVVFAFDRSVGLRGTHRLDVVPRDEHSCLVRHAIDARTAGRMRILWPVAVRWLHDAVLEDLLDRVAADHGHHPASRARWSWWVRLLRRATSTPVRAVTVPGTVLLETALPRVDTSDAFAVRVPRGASRDPQVWADAVFNRPPWWVGALLLARESLVRLIGVEPAGRGAFDAVARTDDEVLLGVDQGHLDFRASVLRGADRVVVSTVVQIHNRRGRLYWSVVRRLHPAIVRAMLRHAAARVPRADLAPGR